MIQEHVLGEIQDVREDGTAVITAGLPNLDRALLRQYKRVEIILPDGRRISRSSAGRCTPSSARYPSMSTAIAMAMHWKR